MKKQASTILKWVFITGLSAFVIRPAIAQKERNQSIVTQDQINTINELVKPVKEQIEKQLNEDKTGNYKAYQEDVRKMNAAKNSKEKSALTGQIREKYAAFFKEAWANAKIDEKLYQQKIKQIFPDAISSLIQFQPFLNFSIVKSFSNNTPQTPPPVLEDKCIDVCSIAAGEINGTSGLISGGGGQYGNCFLKTSAWGAAAGMNHLYGYLKNNITIPGTLPNDARKLHVRKSYELKMEATSFAVLGFGYAETRATTYQANEYLFVMSPVIFGASKIISKSMSEDYLLEKRDVAKSIFNTDSGTFAYLVSGNWCFSEFSSIRWSICEEK
jgi:hypothetical protein